MFCFYFEDILMQFLYQNRDKELHKQVITEWDAKI